MGSPSAMGELLSFRHDGDNDGGRGQCVTAVQERGADGQRPVTNGILTYFSSSCANS